MHPPPRIAAVFALACACAAPPPTPEPASVLLRASRVFDGRSAHEYGWDAAIARLAGADAVFLGESHLDRLTHEAELEFLRRLAAARGGRVALALEMFERDVQPALDAYLAGDISEPEFLARARPWPNYRTDYRPLVEFARAQGIPVIASNLPAELRRELVRGGQAALDALPAERRALAPARLIENPPEYWARVEQATLGHGAMGLGGSGDGGRLFDGQNLWDNTMAESVARALDERPDRMVIHVNGGFHSSRWQGTVWQLRQRLPQIEVKTVAIEAVGDLAGARPEGLQPAADVLVLVESRARSADGGVRAVSVPREHPWRLAAPADGAAPRPLLVWLCDDGQTVEDALRLWRPAVGEEAAVLALEPSFPYLGEDGVRAGRWFFPGSAAAGGALATAAFARALEEALAPGLGLEARRVVLAGEGAGATMAALTARFAREQGFRALAFAPRAREEFALISLPDSLPDDRPARTLEIWSERAERGGWESLSAQDAALRLRTSVHEWPAPLAERERTQLQAVRASLGLAPLPDNPAAEVLLGSAPAGERAELVARVLARRVREQALPAPPSLVIRAADFADGARLPRSSGAFGGTTIVIVPETAGADELAAWLALEDPDVLQARSRFHRLRIAHGDGERSPRAVIERLRAENSQRRDFLLVPAVFCAERDELRALRESLGELAAALRLELEPGLGARLPIEP